MKCFNLTKNVKREKTQRNQEELSLVFYSQEVHVRPASGLEKLCFVHVKIIVF